MTDDLRARFGPEYDAAFSRYLARPGEAGLAVAYEIGRGAVARGLSLLDLSAMHHGALLRELRAARDPQDLERRVVGGAAFFGEVLATFEMTRRGFVERLAAQDEEVSGRPTV
jgi:hypothetical protein